MISGGTASGKTTTALALAFWLNKTVGAAYAQWNEPRAPALRADAFAKAFNERKSPVMVVDSLNAFLEFQSTQQKNDTIFKGGLRMSVVQYLRDLQHMALEARRCLIGVVNTSVFPIENELEGVFEGRIIPRSPGLVEKRDRTLRENQTLSIPFGAMTAAGEVLGYKVERTKINFTRF